MTSFQRPEILNEGHRTEAFDCGKAPLNEFLKLHALDKQRAMLSRTYVVTSGAVIAGYYTLAYISLVQNEMPKKLGRGMPASIPAMLMARFAVEHSFQGQGLGRSLFTDAIRRTWTVMSSGAAPVRFFVVDAKDEEAERFYLRFDMVPAPRDSLQPYPARLYLSYKTLRMEFEGEAETDS